MEDEYIEYVQKRVRNLQKRKSKLEGYEAIRQTEPAKLNSDQIAALANKDSVDAPLKELQDALKLYKESTAQHAAKVEREVAEQVKVAEKRGRDEGRATLKLFSEFLRTVSLKHQAQDTAADELAAVDELLQRLYMGDDGSMEAIDKLAAKSDEVVHGTWTYAQLNALTSEGEKEPVVEEKQEVVKQEPTISFLQEDELAQTAHAEAPAMPAEVKVNGTSTPAESTDATSSAPTTNGSVKTPSAPNGQRKNRRPKKNAKETGTIVAKDSNGKELTSAKESKDSTPRRSPKAREPREPKSEDGWEKASSRRNDKKPTRKPQPKN